MKHRFLAIGLILALLLGLLPTAALAQNSAAVTEAASPVTVEGTNDFGALLAEDLQAQLSGETGCSVTALEITGRDATVTYDTLEAAYLVVGLYSDDGLQLLQSAVTTVYPDANTATVTFTEEMPAHFLAKAYLLDPYDASPLCTCYETANYTQAIQDLRSSTVEDYDADRVWNLDADPTTNFAVYAPDTIVLPVRSGVNTVTKADPDARIYVIEQADATVTGLQAGDILAYPYAEGQILIVKVDTLSVSGTTATIQGAPMEMDEAFSYVKLEVDGTTGDFTYDDTNLADGVTYLGMEEPPPAGSVWALEPSYDWEGDTTHDVSLKYEIKKTFDGEAGAISGKAELTASLGVKIETKLTYYIALDQQVLTFDAEHNLTLTGEITGKAAASLPLGSLGFSPIPGIYIGFEPELKAEFSGKMEFTAGVSGISSIVYLSGSGLQTFTPTPKSSMKLTVEGSLFVGLDLKPHAAVLDGNVLEIELEALIGVELAKITLTGTDYEVTSEHPASRHGCGACLKGEVNWKAEGKASVTLLRFTGLEALKLESNVLKRNGKLGVWYYSFDLAQGGMGSCPSVSYRVILRVEDADGNPQTDTMVSDENYHTLGRTDGSGQLICYLPAGRHALQATIDGTSIQRVLVVTDACKYTLCPTNPGSDILDGAELGQITDNGPTAADGSCGTGVTWKLHANGTLIISGVGRMTDYAIGTAPWFRAYEKVITAVIVQPGVTYISDYAFYSCDNLAAVTVADSVTAIGDYAFAHCGSLADLQLGGVRTIGTYAFTNCGSLTDLTLNGAVTTVSDHAFDSCTNLKQLTIGDNVRTLGSQAFSFCTALTDVQIGSGVTTIGDGPFYYCRALPAIQISSANTAYTTDEAGVLYTRDFTTLVQYPGGRTGSYAIADQTLQIGGYAFAHSAGLTGVSMNDRVTKIGQAAFLGCADLTEVTLPDSVTVIDYNAFASCGNLKNVTLGTQLTTICQRAFASCNAMQVLTIPASVTSIETYAFDSCRNLGTVTFLGSAPKLGDYPFNACTLTVRYPATDPSWSGVAGTQYGAKSISWAAYQPEAANVVPDPAPIAVLTPPEDAIFGGDYGEEASGSVTYKTASFTGLVPGAQYVLLCLRDAETDTPLAPDNLLYITQAAADETGALSFRYLPCTEVATAYVMACGASHRNLQDAAVTFPDMTAADAPVLVSPTVTWQGTVLTEGQDYILSGDVAYTNAGTYTCVLRGIKNYTGTVAVAYTVAADPEDIHQHDHEAVVTEPTCTEPGFTTYTCACGDTYTADEVAALGHAWDNGTVTTKPTAAKPGVKTFTCTRTGCGATRTEAIPAIGISNPFTDVQQGAFYYDPVLWAVANGITAGTSATTFSPDANCTRAQVVTFLWRAAGCPKPTVTKCPFTDVTKDFYYDAMLWAVENGITTGTGNGKFSPEANCTRAQVVTFLWRATEEPAPASTECSFTDVTADSYYYNAMLWAVENRITTGTGSGKFSPDLNCTRSQVVTFLYRFYN